MQHRVVSVTGVMGLATWAENLPTSMKVVSLTDSNC